MSFSESLPWPKPLRNSNDTYTYHRRATFILIVDALPFLIADMPVDAPERRRLPPLLRRAWYGLNQAFRRRIAHLEITPDQFTVMRILIESEAARLNQCALTEVMSSDPNTVASLLKRMEQAGLIDRQRHEKDRRAHQISLKPAGKRKYGLAREIAVALQAEVLESLPQNRRESFLEDLASVADACRKSAVTVMSRTGRKAL